MIEIYTHKNRFGCKRWTLSYEYDKSSIGLGIETFLSQLGIDQIHIMIGHLYLILVIY